MCDVNIVRVRWQHANAVIIVAFIRYSNDLIGHLLIVRNGLSLEIVKSIIVWVIKG